MLTSPRLIRRVLRPAALAMVCAALALPAAYSVATHASGTQAVGRTPVVGEKAPDFTLATLDGPTVTLSEELRRGPVVLILLRGWPSYQCPFCVRQFGEFLGRRADLEAAGTRVLWVYPTSDRNRDHATAFISSKDVPANFRLLLDPEFGFTLRYGLRWDAPSETSYPSTFVIDRSGIVRFVEVSRAHGGRTAVADVLKALAGLR